MVLACRIGSQRIKNTYRNFQAAIKIAENTANNKLMAKVIVFLLAAIPGFVVAAFLSTFIRQNTNLPPWLCFMLGFGSVIYVFHSALK